MATALMLILLCVFIFFFLRACGYNKTLTAITTGWIILQSALALSGFYRNTSALPPRMMFMIMPPFLFVLWLSFSSKGKRLSGVINTGALVYLQAVRIGIEIVLFLLYTQGRLPVAMTFEGHNFDILAGVTAPIVAYYVFTRRTASKTLLHIWNTGALLLLLTVVITGALSVPGPLQKLNFDMPNTAMLEFPFNFIPGLIVPIALLTHLKVMRGR